ncbi:MAG: HNH endonuclease signature motif containing protein [Paracoccaceae bacterium]|nr:HNH endonuclease signature motif containing protein [Paracoccaceae bacterium]MDE2917032.1 HNH endonuclease signature motif containing protein [Paracoccaceae bacterium]
MKLTQLDLLMEYFRNNPDRDIEHKEIVSWAYLEWKRRTGKDFADPDRGIRSLHQKGMLIKVSKGVYRYDEQMLTEPILEDFTEQQKMEILRLGEYKCAICGARRSDGVELHVDHIKPKDLGGRATIENGQVLCSKHNFRKKNLNQTETGKKMFLNLLQLARVSGDNEMVDFCEDVLKVYENHGINGHIVWKRSLF